MIYLLNKGTDREAFIEKCNKVLEEGKVVELVVKNPNRSLAQNRYLHLLIGALALKLGNSSEYVKQVIFKEICNIDIFKVVLKEKVVLKGKAKTIQRTQIRSTKELTTAEMTTAINRFRNWSVMEVGYYLPEPNEGLALLEIESEIDKAKEYIEQPQ